MPWRPALLGRFCRERGRSCQDSDAIADPTLAGGEGQIHYLLLRRHAFLFCTAIGDIRSHNWPG